MIETYFRTIDKMLQQVLTSEAERMKQAAAKVADCIAGGESSICSAAGIRIF